MSEMLEEPNVTPPDPIQAVLADVANLIDAVVASRLTPEEIERRLALAKSAAPIPDGSGTDPAPAGAPDPTSPATDPAGPHRESLPLIGRAESVIMHPSVRASARHWATVLRRHGITDTDEFDLLQDAWWKAHQHLESGEVRREIAFVCRVVENLAKMRLRRHDSARVYTRDPGQLAQHVDRRRPLEVVEARQLADETRAHLDAERAAIWAGLRKRLGEPRRPEAVWAAALEATQRLLLAESYEDWGIRESLALAMANSDEFFRADDDPDARGRTLLDRRRKRVSRDLPFVSYVVLWCALRWALQHDQRACRRLARRHHAFVQALLPDVRNQERLAGIMEHLAEVERAMTE